MSKWGKVAIVFSVCAVASGIVTSAHEANANFRRVNATTCVVLSKTSGANVYYGAWGTIDNLGAATESAQFVCPVDDDSTVGHAAMTGLYVDANESNAAPYTASNTVRAVPCLVAYDRSGSSCSPTIAQASAHGWNSLSLDLTYWHMSAYASWYPSVQVQMAGQTGLTGWLAIQ